MNFGDLVSATSPETGMFYGIYAGEGRCWKYCTGVQELIKQDTIKCTSIRLAGGVFKENWFENRAKEIEVGSEVWCSNADYDTAIEKPHMTFVVVGKEVGGYWTVDLEDVEKYNKGHQVTIFPWNFAVPTGKEVFVADLSVKKKKKKKKEERPTLSEVAPERYEPKFQPGDHVLCVAGNCDVDEGETYEVLEGEGEDSRFVKVLTRKGGQNCFTYRFKKVKPGVVLYEPEFQPGDLVECVEGNGAVLKGSFYRVVKSYLHPGTSTRFVTIKCNDGFTQEAYERRFVLVPKGDKWSFEINNGAQVNSSEIAENLTRKKPVIYHTGAIEGKAFFEIHSSFILKWQQFEDLWDEAHEYLTFVKDHETYRTYVTDLSNIDSLLHIFRAVKKHPWPANGFGRRKVEVFRPVL